MNQKEKTMSFGDVARGRITEARNVLIQRRGQTQDAAEKAAIDQAIADLNDARGLINQVGLLEAAAMVVEATGQLEKVMTSASLDPMGAYAKEMGELFERLGDLFADAGVGEHLEPAPENQPLEHSAQPQAIPPELPSSAPPDSAVSVEPSPGSASAAASGSVSDSGPEPNQPEVPLSQSPMPTADPAPENPPQASSASLPSIGTGLKFAPLRGEYQAWFDALVVRPEYADKVKWHVDQLLKYQSRYQAVSSRTNNMPWAMIGVIHAMECGFRFTGHLHNGDPLTQRTRHVPSGRPSKGSPPFSWEQSAVDALTMEGQSLDKVSDWSIPHILHLLERYNGFGYRKRGRPTPYLWSFSNLFEKGKYVSDGRFDPNAVSKQCGAAVMLKALLNKGVALS
jgi:lysozyme family protein